MDVSMCFPPEMRCPDGFRVKFSARLLRPGPRSRTQWTASRTAEPPTGVLHRLFKSSEYVWPCVEGFIVSWIGSVSWCTIRISGAS